MASTEFAGDHFSKELAPVKPQQGSPQPDPAKRKSAEDDRAFEVCHHPVALAFVPTGRLQLLRQDYATWCSILDAVVALMLKLWMTISTINALSCWIFI